MGVRVCGDLHVPTELDTLRVSILDAERNERRAGVVALLECPGDKLKLLPQTVELGAFDGEAWILVQGLQDGIERIRVERRVRLHGDEATRVVLGLNRDCVGVSCALGQTCRGGACVLVPWESDDSQCASVPLGDVVEVDVVEELDVEISDVEVEPPRYCPPEETSGDVEEVEQP